MPVRRSADPICVQRVWDAIRSANHQRQVADYQRIIKYLQRVSQCTVSQAELYMKQCLDDELILAVQRTAHKGPRLGTQVESYKIANPDSKPVMDGKDWYCIECHLAGDVTACQRCHRVFHAECAARAKQKPNLFKAISDELTKPEENIVKLEDATAAPNVEPEKPEIDAPEPVEEQSERLTKEDEASSLNNNTENDEPLEAPTIVAERPLNTEPVVYNEKMCSICNTSKFDTDLGLERGELNRMLAFILERIRSWLPINITNTMAPSPNQEWQTDAELAWRAQQVFCVQMDMAKMETKIQSLLYATLYEFQTDVLTIQHNVAVFHGTESQEYGASELMLNDCVHDIKELINCVDCYKHSNEKVNNNWFCLPCRKPHKLVWAKQKGYPYWPAKVIKEADSGVDVRFFGGKYERSLLPRNCIKPITVSKSTLNIKRSSAFNRALEQLVLHQRLLENPSDVLNLQTPKEKRKTPMKPKKHFTAAKRKSFDDADVYEFHDSPNDLNYSINPKKRHSTSSTNKTPLKASPMPRFKGKAKSFKQFSPSKDSTSTINLISDDECLNSSFTFGYDGNEPVTSSTEECFNPKDSTDTMQILEQPYSDAVEKMRRKLETTKEMTELIKTAMDCMQAEMDRQGNEHNEHTKRMLEAHSKQLSETKKKQWCYNCEQDAIYHCCWNTAYCSQICQQQHWQAEHKKVCRRKR